MSDPLKGKKKFKFVYDQLVYADSVEEARKIMKKMWDDTHEDFQHEHPTEYFGIKEEQ